MELKINGPLHIPKEPRNSFVVRVETDGEDAEWKDTELGPFIEGEDEYALEALLKLLEAMNEADFAYSKLRYDDPSKPQYFHYGAYVKYFPAWFVDRSDEDQWQEYCEETGSTLSWDEYIQLRKDVVPKISMWWPSVRDGVGDQLIYQIDVIYIDSEGVERNVDWSL